MDCLQSRLDERATRFGTNIVVKPRFRAVLADRQVRPPVLIKIAIGSGSLLSVDQQKVDFAKPIPIPIAKRNSRFIQAGLAFSGASFAKHI
jgi:hypothetical protein